MDLYISGLILIYKLLNISSLTAYYCYQFGLLSDYFPLFRSKALSYAFSTVLAVIRQRNLLRRVVTANKATGVVLTGRGLA